MRSSRSRPACGCLWPRPGTDAPTVLLLHGFPQHWWEWRKVIPPFAERYRVVAPDLRGAGGRTRRPTGTPWAMFLADVLALLDALGLRQVGLVLTSVRSLGSGSADHPERVAAFLCLGPHPYLRFKPQMLAGIPQLWFQPVVATPGLGPWALRTDRLARHLLAGSTTTPDSITDEDLAVFTGRLRAQGHPEAGSALYRNLILPEMGRFLASTSYRKEAADRPDRLAHGRR